MYMRIRWYSTFYYAWMEPGSRMGTLENSLVTIDYHYRIRPHNIRTSLSLIHTIFGILQWRGRDVTRCPV